jgi:hypothetical protein
VPGAISAIQPTRALRAARHLHLNQQVDAFDLGGDVIGGGTEEN